MEYMAAAELEDFVTCCGWNKADRANVFFSSLLYSTICEQFEFTNVLWIEALFHFFMLIFRILEHDLDVCHIADHSICLFLELFDLLQYRVHVLNVVSGTLDVRNLLRHSI